MTYIACVCVFLSIFLLFSTALTILFQLQREIQSAIKITPPFYIVIFFCLFCFYCFFLSCSKKDFLKMFLSYFSEIEMVYKNNFLNL